MTESERLQRYEWEDCLIEATALKLIPKGWASSALRLSRQFNWTPKKTGKEPGLYWANRIAAKSVGIGESTMYEHVKGLKEHGFLTVKAGNLIPRLPSNHEAIRTQFDERVKQLTAAQDQEKDSGREEADSRNQSPGSTGHDTFTEESCSDNPSTEDLLAKTDATHPALSGGGTNSHREDPLPLDSSNRKSSPSSLASLWRRIASNTPSAANRETANV